MTDDCCSVWVAEDNLCAHINQLIHKEQAALKHLLVNKHCSLRLCGNHEEDRQEIGCQAWPGGIGNVHNRAINEALDRVVILLWNIDIVASLLKLDTHTGKLRRDNTEVFVRYILDGKLRLRHCRHTDEATHLNHIGQHSVLRTAQLLHTLNGQEV